MATCCNIFHSIHKKQNPVPIGQVSFLTTPASPLNIRLLTMWQGQSKILFTLDGTANNIHIQFWLWLIFPTSIRSALCLKELLVKHSKTSILVPLSLCLESTALQSPNSVAVCIRFVEHQQSVQPDGDLLGEFFFPHYTLKAKTSIPNSFNI